MNNVNQTLYIPLYGKAYVSRRGLILEDKKAEEIWQKESFPLHGKSASKWLAFYMGMRSAVMDEWLRQQIAVSDNTAVLHIGCGMDARIHRSGNGNHYWYDVDFPAVICERKRYFTETDRYRMISGDVRNNVWLDEIPACTTAIVVMEGVSMYMTPDELRNLCANLCTRFEKVSLLMDCYTVMAAKLSRYRNPINDVGVTEVYGMDSPMLPDACGLAFVREHDMTPRRLIDELPGMEKRIFRRLYAGSLSRKLYRMYEYGKV